MICRAINGKLSDLSKPSLGIKGNIAWNTAGNFVYLFSQWLLSYFVVRFLGYESAGVLTLATTVTGSLIGISLYGMRSFQVSDINEKYSDRTYKISRIITSALALLVCTVFVILNGYSFYFCLCIIVYMCFKISESASDVYQGILQKAMRMDYIGISFILKGVITLALFILAVVITNDLLAGIVVLCLSSTAIIFSYDARKAKKFTHHPSQLGLFASVKALLWECLPVAAFALTFNTISLIPRYFLEAQLGVEALGFYGTIALPVVIVQVSASFVFSPLITPFAQKLNEGDINGFKTLLGKVVLFIVALSAVALLGFGLIGDWFLVLLFGPTIEPYTYLLMPLVVCTILVALSWFLSTLLVVLRRLKALLAASVASFVVVISGSIYFISTFGLNGASFILILGLTIFTLLCSLILIKEIKSSADNHKKTPG